MCSGHALALMRQRAEEETNGEKKAKLNAELNQLNQV